MKPIVYNALVFVLFMNLVIASDKKAKKKKDIRDYNEAEIESIYDQWEEHDPDDVEEGDKEEWKRTPPKIDVSKFNPDNPEALLSESKKGRTLMMFATVSGNPSEKEAEQLTQLWQTSLFNMHMEVQRYVVGSSRVLFVLTDGSKAWEVKDFLVKQERCESVTIEGKDYPGKGAEGQRKPEKTKTSEKDSKKSEESQKKRKQVANEAVDKTEL